jgi:hypothetical protein
MACKALRSPRRSAVNPPPGNPRGAIAQARLYPTSEYAMRECRRIEYRSAQSATAHQAKGRVVGQKSTSPFGLPNLARKGGPIYPHDSLAHARPCSVAVLRPREGRGYRRWSRIKRIMRKSPGGGSSPRALSSIAGYRGLRPTEVK